MSHKKILTNYIVLVGCAVSVIGSYVACGAQNYRVAVDDDVGKRVQGNKSSATGTRVDKLGIHSNQGWLQLPIRYRTSYTLSATQVAQIQKAMKTWELAVGKNLFSYDGKEDKVGDQFNKLYDPLNDAVNGHYFDNQWIEKTGKAKTVLATTLWENNPKNDEEIVKSDVLYNNQYYVFGDSLAEFSQGERVIVDLESLILHELGHLLGLSHINISEDRYSVMNPSLFIGEGMITRRLSQGDIERVREVYKDGDRELAKSLEVANDFASQN